MKISNLFKQSNDQKQTKSVLKFQLGDKIIKSSPECLSNFIPSQSISISPMLSGDVIHAYSSNFVEPNGATHNLTSIDDQEVLDSHEKDNSIIDSQPKGLLSLSKSELKIKLKSLEADIAPSVVIANHINSASREDPENEKSMKKFKKLPEILSQETSPRIPYPPVKPVSPGMSAPSPSREADFYKLLLSEYEKEVGDTEEIPDLFKLTADVIYTRKRKVNVLDFIEEQQEHNLQDVKAEPGLKEITSKKIQKTTTNTPTHVDKIKINPRKSLIASFDQKSRTEKSLKPNQNKHPITSTKPAGIHTSCTDVRVLQDKIITTKGFDKKQPGMVNTIKNVLSDSQNKMIHPSSKMKIAKKAHIKSTIKEAQIKLYTKLPVKKITCQKKQTEKSVKVPISAKIHNELCSRIESPPSIRNPQTCTLSKLSERPRWR